MTTMTGTNCCGSVVSSRLGLRCHAQLRTFREKSAELIEQLVNVIYECHRAISEYRASSALSITHKNV